MSTVMGIWRAASRVKGSPVARSVTSVTSVTSKKSPIVDKSCPKMISLEKLNISTPLQKLPKNVGDLGKLIVA